MTSIKTTTEEGHNVVTIATSNDATVDPPVEPEGIEQLKLKFARLKVENENLKSELESFNKQGKEFKDDSDNENTLGLSGHLRRVNHYSRVVSDAEVSKKFYTDVLGCTILNRPNFPMPGYWLWMGNIQLHLIQGKHADPHCPGVPTGNVNHISFEAYDIAKTEEKLIELQVNYQKKLIPEGKYLLTQLFFPDPDGYYIEICTCADMNDFVFANERDDAYAQRLSAYEQGINATGSTLAILAGIEFNQEKHKAKDEHMFHQQLQRLEHAFKTITKGKEKIEIGELSNVLVTLGHDLSAVNVEAMEKMKKFMSDKDANGDGQVEFVEFVEIMAEHLQPENSMENLKAAFAKIDENKNGYISKEELKHLLWGLGEDINEQVFEESFKTCDATNDGKIVFEEFLKYFDSKRGNLKKD